jgi:hypothetical protein
MRRGDFISGIAGSAAAWPAVLYNVSVATAGQDAQPEARQVFVPDEVLTRPDLGRIDDALSEFRHLRSVDLLICFLPPAAFAPGSTMEARGRESWRVRAKNTVVVMSPEVN